MWYPNPQSKNDAPSTWSFDTSEGTEFDALFVAFGKGSFYIKDSRDPDGIVHEILYVALGVSKGKGPIPWGIGGSFSTPDMWSTGLGNIRSCGGAPLALSDFGGPGLIIAGAAGASGPMPSAPTGPPDKGSFEGLGAEMILFGGIIHPKAYGWIVSKQKMPPGAGGTIMPCIFTIDP